MKYKFFHVPRPHDSEIVRSVFADRVKRAREAYKDYQEKANLPPYSSPLKKYGESKMDYDQLIKSLRQKTPSAPKYQSKRIFSSPVTPSKFR
jgi:hypothetical protein